MVIVPDIAISDIRKYFPDLYGRLINLQCTHRAWILHAVTADRFDWWPADS